jgi:cytochrome c oxidase subunit I
MHGIADTLDGPEEAISTQVPLLARLHDWVVTVDHKRLGIMYICTGLVFLLVAGLEASLIRLQLVVPEHTLLSPQMFNRLFTMHGTTMVFFVGIPIRFGTPMLFCTAVTPPSAGGVLLGKIIGALLRHV